MKRLIEKIWIKIAWKLPRILVMWCTMRLGAHATTGKYGTTYVADLRFMEAVKRWDDR